MHSKISVFIIKKAFPITLMFDLIFSISLEIFVAFSASLKTCFPFFSARCNLYFIWAPLDDLTNTSEISTVCGFNLKEHVVFDYSLCDNSFWSHICLEQCIVTESTLNRSLFMAKCLNQFKNKSNILIFLNIHSIKVKLFQTVFL